MATPTGFRFENPVYYVGDRDLGWQPPAVLSGLPTVVDALIDEAVSSGTTVTSTLRFVAKTGIAGQVVGEVAEVVIKADNNVITIGDETFLVEQATDLASGALASTVTNALFVAATLALGVSPPGWLAVTAAASGSILYSVFLENRVERFIDDLSGKTDSEFKLLDKDGTVLGGVWYRDGLLDVSSITLANAIYDLLDVAGRSSSQGTGLPLPEPGMQIAHYHRDTLTDTFTVYDGTKIEDLAAFRGVPVASAFLGGAGSVLSWDDGEAGSFFNLYHANDHGSWVFARESDRLSVEHDRDFLTPPLSLRYRDIFTDAVVAVGNDATNLIVGSDSEAAYLSGAGGDDHIFGRQFDDTLLGGGGRDALRGGAGRDTFAGTLSELDGDRIYDLEVGDRIFVVGADLSDADVDRGGGSLELGAGTTIRADLPEDATLMVRPGVDADFNPGTSIEVAQRTGLYAITESVGLIEVTGATSYRVLDAGFVGDDLTVDAAGNLATAQYGVFSAQNLGGIDFTDSSVRIRSFDVETGTEVRSDLYVGDYGSPLVPINIAPTTFEYVPTAGEFSIVRGGAVALTYGPQITHRPSELSQIYSDVPVGTAHWNPYYDPLVNPSPDVGRYQGFVPRDLAYSNGTLYGLLSSNIIQTGEPVQRIAVLEPPRGQLGSFSHLAELDQAVNFLGIYSTAQGDLLASGVDKASERQGIYHIDLATGKADLIGHVPDRTGDGTLTLIEDFVVFGAVDDLRAALAPGATTPGAPVPVNGTIGGDDLLARLLVEAFTLGDGPDRLFGTLTDLFGDVVMDFGTEDALVFRSTVLDRAAIDVVPGSAILQIDADGDGAADGAITLEGDFSGGDFMAVAYEDNTVVTYETFLAPLSEGQGVDAARVNGVNNQLYLTGDGNTGFRVTLNQGLSQAQNANTLGVYEIDADDTIVDARILVFDTRADPAAVVDITGVEAGHELGFFLIGDGADLVSTIAPGDTFRFVSRVEAAGAPDATTIALEHNGRAIDEPVLHSYSPSLNADGMQHALSGVDVGGMSITIGFEDLAGGGDRDFQDVVFSVSTFDIG